MAEQIEDMVARFSADLPEGYEVRLDESRTRIRLVVRRREGWSDIAGLYSLDLACLVDALRTSQGELIEHDFGKAWPRCPVHGSHPLRPEIDGWHCPDAARTGSDDLWTYGSLRGSHVGHEPHRADGEVRWYLDDLGWGVIAHHEGDLIVRGWTIEDLPHGNLHEGQSVDYEISGGHDGPFREAKQVRPSTG